MRERSLRRARMPVGRGRRGWWLRFELAIVSVMHADLEKALNPVDGSRTDPAALGGRRGLTVVDVALHYGEGYDGLAIYLRAKQRYAQATGALVHHVIVPAEREAHRGGWHELSAARRLAAGERHFTGRSQRLHELLGALRADVVVIHGPLEGADRVIDAARSSGAQILAVTRHPVPAPIFSLERALNRWWRVPREQRALARVDVVTAPAPAALPSASAFVRLGVDPEFRPDPGVRRGQEVVFAGELSYTTHVAALLLAANCPDMRWPVRLIGRGHQARGVRRAVRVFGLAHRVTLEPFTADRERLARVFASAGCVVNPGEPARCQLVMLEAAATGAPIVAPEGAAIAALAPMLTFTFRRETSALANAIQSALTAPPDHRTGVRVADENSWQRAFERELVDLRALLSH